MLSVVSTVFILGICICSVRLGQSMYTTVSNSAGLRPHEDVNISIHTYDDGASKHVSFDAFGKHYELRLQRNTELVSPAFEIINGEKPSNFEELINCHYLGTLANYSSDEVAVSASICEGHGFHARVTNLTDYAVLILKPRAIFLNASQERLHIHSVSDSVVAFWAQSSSSERDGVLRMRRHRRRLPVFHNSPGNRAFVEIYAAIDPVRVRNFDFDTAALMSSTVAHINAVSDVFRAVNWGTVGGLNTMVVVVRYLEYMQNWDDIGQPAPTSNPNSSRCDTSNPYDDDPGCAVFTGDYLQKVRDWSFWKDWNKFDNLLLMTDLPFQWAYTGSGTQRGGIKGVALVNTMCTHVAVALTSFHSVLGNDHVRTTVHELGHNFGFHHDGDPNGNHAACPTNAGVMGNGPTDFSSCSVSVMEALHANGVSLTCLKDEFTTGGRRVVTHQESLAPIGVYDCVQVQGIQIRTGVNNIYTFQGMDGGLPYYKGGQWLYYIGNRWLVGPTYGVWSYNGWCQTRSFDVADCDGVWLGEPLATTTGWNLTAGMTDCASSAAFMSDELVCLDDDERHVGRTACVYNHNTTALSWTGSFVVFELMETRCRQGSIVYQFGLTSVDEDVIGAAETEAEVTTSVSHLFADGLWFLFFLEEERYTGSNVTWSRWVIASDMSRPDVVAYCEKTALSECVQGEWMVRHHDADSWFMKLDAGFGLKQSHCVFEDSDGSDAARNNGGLPSVWVAVIVVVVVVAVVIIGGMMLLVRRAREVSAKDAGMVEEEQKQEHVQEVDEEAGGPKDTVGEEQPDEEVGEVIGDPKDTTTTN